MNPEIIRFSIFIAVFLVLSIIEWYRPANKQNHTKSQRLHNLTLAALSQILLRLLFIVNGVSIATFAAKYDLGLFNIVLIPNIMVIVLGIIFLDLSIYWQHIAMHRFTFLWRLHQVHHTDLILNVTSGMRFHPLEALISMLYRSCIILCLGLPAIAVICFETILNTMSLFSHANIKLPKNLDFKLRKIIITPALHFIHHTICHADQNHNFGFSTSLWDRLFKTYQEYPSEESLGIKGCNKKTTNLVNSIVLPFKGAV